MVWLFALASALRFAVFVVGLASADADGRGQAFFWHDSGQYLNPARSLVRHGQYTVDSDGKQVPYCLRPPAYPLFMAACYVVGGERIAAILLPQIVLGAMACALAYWIAAMLFDHRIGLVTGLLLSLDQMLIAFSNKVMAETLSLALLTGSTALLLLFLAHRRPVFLWLSSVSLGLCTLAHGSTLYYAVIPLAVVACWAGFSRRERLRWTLTFAAVFALVIGVWQARNFCVFGIYQVVPTGHTLVQTAARVLLDEQPQRTYSDLATERHHHTDAVFRQRYALASVDWSDSEFRRRYFPLHLATQNGEALRVFREHWQTYLKVVLSSFLKITVLPLPYAELCRFAQAQPLDAKEENLRATMLDALRGLLHGKVGEFWQQARRIPFCKLTGFAWNTVYWLLTIPASFLGGYILIRRFAWWYSLILLGTIAYFALTTSIVQAGDGMQRYRLRILPCLYCVAAVGWFERVRRP